MESFCDEINDVVVCCAEAEGGEIPRTKSLGHLFLLSGKTDIYLRTIMTLEMRD